MALFLKDFWLDLALLPFPEEANFDYLSLCNVANELHLKFVEANVLPTLTLDIWTDMAIKHLSLTTSQALVYFETFSLLLQKHQSLSEAIPCLPFLMLLFAQLHKQPLLRDSVLKGDDYPRRILHAHHPLGCIGGKFASHRRVVDECDASCVSGAATPVSMTECSSPRSLSSTPTPFGSDSAAQTTEHPVIGSMNDSAAHSNALQPHVALSRFPTLITDARHHLASFWRSSGKKWLYLTYIVFKGNHIEKPFSHEGTSSHFTRHGLTETLELQVDWIAPVLEFLFTAICTSNASVRAKLKHRFIEWVERVPLADGSMESTDATLLTEEEEEDASFKNEPVVGMFKDFVSFVLKDKLMHSVSIELINQWIMWAIMERPLNLRILRLTEHGIAYGYEDARHWFEDDQETPQVLIARKRNKLVVVENSHVANTTLFIHRCHEAQIYILGAVKNVFISRCRNTNIVVGAVAQQLRLIQCERVSVSAVCGQFFASPTAVSSSSPTTADGNVAYIHTALHPVICNASVDLPSETMELATDVKHRTAISLAPFNTFYEGILNEISDAGLSLDSKNLWDKAIVAWDPTKNQRQQHQTHHITLQHHHHNQYQALQPETSGNNSPFTFLPPIMFFLTPTPFVRTRISLAESLYQPHSSVEPVIEDFDMTESGETSKKPRKSLSGSSLTSNDSSGGVSMKDDVLNFVDMKDQTQSGSREDGGDHQTNIISHRGLPLLQSNESLLTVVDETLSLNETSHQQADASFERSKVMSILPKAYKTWLESIETILGNAQSIMGSIKEGSGEGAVSETRQSLQSCIGNEFQTWLKKTGKLVPLASLLAAEKDAEKLRESIPLHPGKMRRSASEDTTMEEVFSHSS